MKPLFVSIVRDDVKNCFLLFNEEFRSFQVSVSRRVSLIMTHLEPFPIIFSLSIIFVAYIPPTTQQTVRDSANGISFANFARHGKRRLDTNQLQSSTASEYTECLERCVVHGRCTSLNYGGNGGRECQLLEANKYDSLAKMRVDETFVHFSIKIRRSCAHFKLLKYNQTSRDYKLFMISCQIRLYYIVLHYKPQRTFSQSPSG